METNTQYLEYMFEEEEDEEDYTVERHEFQLLGELLIKTRKMAVGISRSTWEASEVMAQWLD